MSYQITNYSPTTIPPRSLIREPKQIIAILKRQYIIPNSNFPKQQVRRSFSGSKPQKRSPTKRFKTYDNSIDVIQIESQLSYESAIPIIENEIKLIKQQIYIMNNKYRGRLDDAYKVLKTEGCASIKTNIVMRQQKLPSQRLTTEACPFFSTPVKPKVSKRNSPAQKHIMAPVINKQQMTPQKYEKILDLLCLSTQQLKQVFAQPPSTKARVRVPKNNSLPKDFFNR
ncbi:hypothetical protein pb186bvf_013538 [Paramecium bursaria]